MPLGFDRLNERTQRPNAQINFIKPLPTHSDADHEFAKDFLERIAAQSFRVMKKHYISVMSLEEFPYNREFLGRNFNAGEVIQLVLKDKNGNWLSFKFVQMVMMHELAHCKHMNHSRFFWKERNVYADQMRDLWKEGYTGEGLWGKGKALASGQIMHERMPEQGDVPEHLCGGTYRRARGRKRKRGGEHGAEGEKPKISYAERQQKRIARKFGVHGDGNALGEDELVRGGLEQKNRQQGKPRVAQSKRGRELRAMAALARFESAQKQPQIKEDQSSDEGWSDFEDDHILRADRGKTLDVEDDKGTIQLVQVCGDEGERQDEGGQNEMDELRRIGFDDDIKTSSRVPTPIEGKTKSQHTSSGVNTVALDSETESADEQFDRRRSNASHLALVSKSGADTEAESRDGKPTPQTPSVIGNLASQQQSKGSLKKPQTSVRMSKRSQLKVDGEASANELLDADSLSVYKASANSSGNHSSQQALHDQPTRTLSSPPTPKLTSSSPCPICSLDNDSSAATCAVCSHVLKPSVMRGTWRCRSHACRESRYINSGDVGRCGVCGDPKQNMVDAQDVRARSVGVIDADILRWD